MNLYIGCPIWSFKGWVGNFYPKGTKPSEFLHEYARRLTRQFSSMILSGHSLDLETGAVKFHFDREIPIQRTLALLKATEKFLFFDSKKFTGEGEVGYSLRALLSTCHSVIIYTVSSPRRDEMKAAFDGLAADLLTDTSEESDSPQQKSLRLTIVYEEVTTPCKLSPAK